MKNFKILIMSMLIIATSINARAESCEKLGSVQGLYSIYNVFEDTKYENGAMLFAQIQGMEYILQMGGDLDVDGDVMDVREAQIELKTVRKGFKSECAFVNPIFAEPNAVMSISRMKDGNLQLINKNAMSKKAYIILAPFND